MSQLCWENILSTTHNRPTATSPSSLHVTEVNGPTSCQRRTREEFAFQLQAAAEKSNCLLILQTYISSVLLRVYLKCCIRTASCIVSLKFLFCCCRLPVHASCVSPRRHSANRSRLASLLQQPQQLQNPNTEEINKTDIENSYRSNGFM